jgi:uncharacterized protein (TIGR02099 family)
MIRLFKSAAATVWAALLTLVILAGLLSAVAQLATPLLGGLRSDVEHHLGQALRAPVRIERLAVRWRGLGPELVARQVSVQDLGGQSGLELDEVTVALSLADVARHGRIWPTRIGIAGVRLKLVRLADGALAIEGLRPFAADAPTGEAGGRERLAVLLAPERLHITDAEIVVEDRMRGRPPVAFRNGVLLVRNDGARHQINAALDLPDARGTRLSFAADLHAAPDRLADWRGEVHLAVDGARVAPLLAHFLPDHYRLEEATVQARLWVGWEGGEPLWAEGHAAISDLALRGREPARILRLDRLAGRFRWDRQSDGWLLRATDVLVGPPRAGKGGAEWALAWRRADGDPAGLRLRATALEVADLAGVLALRPPGGRTFDRVLQAGPAGRLEDLDLVAVQRRDEGWWWSIGATLRDGRIAPIHPLPALEGVALRIDASVDGGSARLETRDLRATLPCFLRGPVLIDRLTGDLAWRRQGPDWIVESTGIDLANPDLRTRTRFRLDLPADGQATLDLESDLRDGVVARVPAYLPVGIMEPDAIAWLDQAFGSGTLTSGRAVIQGPLADFPFDRSGNGRFEVTLGVEGVDLGMAPGWPRLAGVDAQVRFHGDSLEVNAGQGRLHDTRVLHANARIDSLTRETPLQIKGLAAGPAADVLRFLRESPLSGDFAEAVEGLAAEGDSRLALDLALAIDGVGKDEVKGSLTFAGARLTHPALPLPLAELQGPLGFDPSGLKAGGIDGKLGAIPLTLDVATMKNGITQITARSAKIELASLGPLLPDPPAWARGAAAFTATLSLDPLQRRSPVALRVESDLAGLAIDLPSPLAKPADARRPLQLEVGFPDKGPLPIRLRYGADVDAAIAADRELGTVTRGEMRFGGEKAQLPEAELFRLRGRLGTLDLPALAAWVQTHAGERRSLGLDVVLGIERVGLGDAGALTAVQIEAREGRTGWEGELRAREVEGRFSVPAAPEARPAVIDLRRLDLRTPEGDSPPGAPRPPPSGTDPRTMPALALTIAKLTVNGQDLGSLRATAARGERGLDLGELLLEGPKGRLAASGSWHKEVQGPMTRVRYQIETKDFGALVVALGFADMIERGPATLTGEQAWPGGPHDFARDAGTGLLELDMGEGRFLEVDPGVGRLMGLLNITALQRRLTLDFRDLFQKGLGFDSVTGRFELRDGSLYTQNLTIKSPSSLIEITGRTGIMARDYDQVVSVTPSLQSALPIAGVLAGGPVGGAAMLVVQGLVGKQFDKIGRVRYSVRGPWADPKIERLAGQIPEPPSPSQPSPDRPPAEGMGMPPGGAPVENAPPAPTQRDTPLPAFH